MPTLIITHEVKDVAHWLASTRREEYFAPLGITTRAFADASGSSRVCLLVETPDVATWEASLQTPEAADAMAHDGVLPESIVGYAEA